MPDRFLHTGLVADPLCKMHDPGWNHPEQPARYDAAFRALCVSGIHDILQKIPCREAIDAELTMAHTQAYVDLVAREAASGAATLGTGDTDICAASMTAARYAVGGVLNAVDSVLRGTVKNAFCLVRPPGHHATASQGMGFCLFNNAALAARHAQRRRGIGRIAIVDWDVHHGNGTQDIFYRDGSVFYASTHQSPWYPGTGTAEETGDGDGAGTTLNRPFPAGAGRAEILGAFEDAILPALDAFRPELVILSAGFDSRAGDPLGSFQLTDEDFADLTRLTLDLARRHAGGRLVSVLEGGYSLSGLGSAVAAHVRTLADA